MPWIAFYIHILSICVTVCCNVGFHTIFIYFPPNRISHMLTLPKRVLESTGINGLERGQRLNINGYVRSIPFTTSHGKTRRAISIIPHNIELCNDETEPQQDVCIAMLTAHIESPIWHQNNLTMFNLRTHVPVRLVINVLSSVFSITGSSKSIEILISWEIIRKMISSLNYFFYFLLFSLSFFLTLCLFLSVHLIIFSLILFTPAETLRMASLVKQFSARTR